MAQENSLYIYLSHLLIKFFLNGQLNNGSKYQIRFENQDAVEGLYNNLKISAPLFELAIGEYIYNDYNTYFLKIKGKKLIIACHPNEDLLTGLRNNFQLAPGFSSDSAILFIHCSELESINKGADSLSNREMPLHYATVSTNIIREFQEEKTFSPTQREFLKQLIVAESVDYQIENSNVFDLKKYLIILINKKLTKENYNGLGVFYDKQIQEENLALKEVKARLEQNKKWFEEISLNEEHGTLDNYLQRHFDKEGQNLLGKKENWDKVDLDQIKGFVANRDNISFNEYIPNISELTEAGLAIWERDEGKSPAKAKTKNILIFNDSGHSEITFGLKFKRKPMLSNFQGKYQAEVNEENRSIDVTLFPENERSFVSAEMHYRETKDGKSNAYRFKVLVVPFPKEVFRNIRSSYTVQSPKNDQVGLEIYSDDFVIFNERGEDKIEDFLVPYHTYEIGEFQCLQLKLADKDDLESLSVPFKLKYRGATLFCHFVVSDTRPMIINGWSVWNEKNTSKKSYYYTHKTDDRGKDIITLEHATSVYFPTGEFRSNLQLEEQLIDTGYLTTESNGYTLSEGNDEFLPADLKDKYQQIIVFFRGTNVGSFRLLPSTTFIDDELARIYKEYVDVYISHLHKIQDSDSLSPIYRSLLKVGTITETEQLKRLKVGPLHPLNIAYQLELRQVMDEAFFREGNKDLIRKLTPLNLLPFINQGTGEKDYFIALDQDHSPEWLYYVNANIEGQSINRRNVPDMMSSKIREFVRHFSFLYMDFDAPIRLNLINIGNGKEALQGIFQYFSEATRELIQKSKNPSDVYPIRLNIYGSGSFVTYFEQFSKFEDPAMIKKEFDIDLNVLKGKMEIEDFLKLYHEKVQFFVKNSSNARSYEYSHITFHQFNEQQVEKSDNNTKEVATGISLEGIISDLPSIYIHGNYRTGFGIKDLTFSDINPLINLSNKLNSLAHIEGTSNIFKDNYAFASVINKDIKSDLEEVYRASQWVTFINPRVDLSFFKNSKDVVIIHYTDQYSNSSSYDSITITTKWEQYEFIIKEYLSSKIDDIGTNVKGIINMFNALNGYWLLKLGSQNQTEHIHKEKISILSAVKEALAILDHTKITWVVLSMEEILRVTGASGLKQSQGLFSVQNLKKTGQFSDDLLLIGLENINGSLQIYFYPIEVKIGNNSSAVLEKGGNQGRNTLNLLMETLGQQGFNGKLYRNYFAKLILNAAQKLSLYEVWPQYSQKWDDIEQLRGKLLNDEFTIGTLEDHIGTHAIISFRKNESFSKREIFIKENNMIISLFESDGLNDLLLPIDKLKERYSSPTATGITKKDLLTDKYGDSKIYDVIEAKKHHDESGPAHILEIISEYVDEDTFIEQQEEPISDIEVNIDVLPEPKVDAVETAEISTNPLKILFGHKSSTNEVLEWYPTSPHKVMHTNTGIIGTMGTGKTQFTKSLITQLIRNTGDNVDGKKIGILIFDYKGDYIKDDFIKATGAKVFDLHQLPFNPFSLSVGDKVKKLLPLHTASTFQETITKAFGLGNKQTLALIDVIMDAYANVGIYKNDPSTWSIPAPTLKDVFELYIENEKVAKDSLYAALTKLYNFEIFEPIAAKTKPLFSLIDGVTVINLNENSPEIQNLIVAITLDQFYSQMQTEGHSQISGNMRQINKMVLVDEADNFLGKNFDSLKKILKEGREYGVGTILSTQFLNHFATGDNEYSQYILTWIIHRVNEIKDREIYSIFDLPNKKDREELIGEIKSLPIHYSIVNLAGSQPIKIKDKAFWELDHPEKP